MLCYGSPSLPARAVLIRPQAEANPIIVSPVIAVMTTTAMTSKTPLTDQTRRSSEPGEGQERESGTSRLSGLQDFYSWHTVLGRLL